MLQNIENAVYDHPRVLDDFSACILVFDRRTAFMPTELVEEAEGAEETYYSALYSADPADILTDTDGDLTAAYSPTALKDFLAAHSPGARGGMQSHESGGGACAAKAQGFAFL